MTPLRRIAELFLRPENLSGEQPRKIEPATGGDVAPDGEMAPGAGPAPEGEMAPGAGIGDALGAAAGVSVALLAPAADAATLGAALGLVLARRLRTATALVCVWSCREARPSSRSPALPAAARLAARLAGRGHAARASGRLVVVALSQPPHEAVAQASRARAAAGPVPSVIVLAGPRRAAFEELLAAQDLVVVALAPGSDAALARLARDGLGDPLVCDVPPADAARALAGAGLVLLPSARRALAAPAARLA